MAGYSEVGIMESVTELIDATKGLIDYLPWAIFWALVIKSFREFRKWGDG